MCLIPQLNQSNPFKKQSCMQVKPPRVWEQVGKTHETSPLQYFKNSKLETYSINNVTNEVHM